MNKKNLIVGGTSLSPRDQQLLSLLVRSFSNKMMADELGISPDTVKTELRTLYLKIGAHCHNDATIYALNNGWDTDGIYHPLPAQAV